jgi:Arc/MetJ family transcription regulator
LYDHEEAPVTLTRVDVDDEALAEAKRLSGALSTQDIVNLALREYAARHRRIAELDPRRAHGRVGTVEDQSTPMRP